MNNQELIAISDEYLMGTYARFPLAISHGMGATLYNFAGKAYIDFASGIGVNSLGCGNTAWVEAIREQAEKLGHVSNLYHTQPAAKLAKTLCERTGFSKVFFSNSGAESNEGLIKLARKYSRDKYGQGRSTIVTLVNSFHGRTLATLAATGQNVFHDHFFPFPPGFRHALAGDMESVKQAAGGDTAAVLIELVQGEGGVNPLDKDFVRQMEEFCRARDILLLIDEVQTGVGRCGSLFAFQQYGISPDAISFAKGIAGGLPLGGFLTTARCGGILGPGTHATTYGGNPIGAAAAQVVLDTLTEQVLEEVAEKGRYMQARIAAIQSPHVADIRGLGLMIGISLEGIAHRVIAERLNDAGLLALTAGRDTLRFLPPLTITYEEIDQGLAILQSVLGGK